MFDLSTIEEIINAWIADQQHPERYRHQKPIPEITDVRFLVETAFWASLKKEEERPVSFSMIILRQADIAAEFETSDRRQLILTFDRPIPLTLDALGKIAPAFHPQFTSLAIEPDGREGAAYLIWGMEIDHDPN